MSVVTEVPPADCPAIVTLSGSPPKAAMFCWTHSSAATWSRSPRFDSKVRVGVENSLKSRKPSAPSL